MSILGHVAREFWHPENLATKGLTYLLQESSVRESLGTFLKSCGASTSVEAYYSSQDGNHENGIPDLVGHARNGQLLIVLEAKFDAGLTKHQPVSYLEKLGAGGVLVFIVPSDRVDYIWRELVRRVSDVDLILGPKKLQATSRFAMVGPDQKELLVVAWSDVMNAVLDAVVHAKQHVLAEDVRQLQGLCEELASAGFTPLQPEELTSSIWRRVGQMSALVRDVFNVLLDENLVVKDGNLSSGPGYTGLGMKMSNVAVELFFDADACARHYPTPFWLLLPKHLAGDLTEYVTGDDRRLFTVEDTGQPYLALPVRAGVERDDVVADVAKACREVAGKLAKLASPATTPPMPATPAG